jgi:hypothetical protein
VGAAAASITTVVPASASALLHTVGAQRARSGGKHHHRCVRVDLDNPPPVDADAQQPPTAGHRTSTASGAPMVCSSEEADELVSTSGWASNHSEVIVYPTMATIHGHSPRRAEATLRAA